MTTHPAILVVLTIFAIAGLFYVGKLIIWFFVVRPIKNAFKSQNIIANLGDSWDDPVFDA